MSRITRTASIAASPATVWARIGNPADIHQWHPAIDASPADGNGQRSCVLANGAVIRERILEHDDASMRYRYTITESPLPVKDYVSEIRVEAQGSGCVVTWSGSFEAVAAPEEMDATVTGVYESGLAALKEAFEA